MRDAVPHCLTVSCESFFFALRAATRSSDPPQPSGTNSPSPRLPISACHSFGPPHFPRKDVHGRIPPCSTLIMSMRQGTEMQETPEIPMRNARGARHDFRNPLFLPLIPGGGDEPVVKREP